MIWHCASMLGFTCRIEELKAHNSERNKEDAV
jgi:hypothetical protein